LPQYYIRAALSVSIYDFKVYLSLYVKFFLELDWAWELHLIWTGFVPVRSLIVIANSIQLARMTQFNSAIYYS